MKFIFSAVFALSTFLCTAQPFNKVIDFAQLPPDIAATTIFGCVLDSNFYIIAGNQWDIITNSIKTYVARCDYNGNVQWHTKLDFPGPMNSTFRLQALNRHNGDFVITGVERDTFARQGVISVSHNYIYVFSANGDSLLFRKYYGIDSVETMQPVTIATTADSGFILAAKDLGTELGNNNDGFGYFYLGSSVYITRLDKYGNTLWERRMMKVVGSTYIGLFTESVPTKIIPTSDNGCLIAGVTWIADSNSMTHFVMKLAANGNTQWIKNYRPNTYPELCNIDIVASKYGGFYFASNMANTPVDFTQVHPSVESSLLYFGECDSNGNKIWGKEFADTGQVAGYKNTLLRRLSLRKNGDLILSGLAYYNYYEHPIVVISDSVGNIKSYREIEYVSGATSATSNAIYHADETPSGNLLVTGEYKGEGTLPSGIAYGTFGWMVLTDSFGCLVAGCQIADTQWLPTTIAGNYFLPELKLYPNPATDVLHIESSQAMDLELRIIDLVGRVQLSQQLRNRHETINISGLAPGVYTVTVRDGNGRYETHKLLKN